MSSARPAPLVAADLLLLLAVGSPPAAGTTRYVPTSVPAIQLAISASISGDTVLVLQGTFYEHIDLLGKGVVVRSIGGPETTIIDATGQSASVVHLADVGELDRLEGFTLRGGSGTTEPGYFYDGGGILIRDSRGGGPLIESPG